MDSQTVLRWIYSRTCKFEVFVHNRIKKILRNTSRKQWRFVTGEDNPADMCSRGIEPGNFNDLLKFHQGPLFLYYDSSEWNTWPTEESLEPDDCDVNVIRVCSIKLEREEHAIDNCVGKFSSLVRIQRVLGWCLRFVHNARAKAKGIELRNGELDVDETSRALTLCIKRAQEISFQEEVHCLLKGLELPNRSKLRPFKPFIDGLGQLRIGGRLVNAPVDYAAQHPVLLPADQLVTHRIIWDQHIRNYHLKTERLLCHLRSRFWILSGRKTVKSTINKCIPCKRRDVKPVPPIMASLPKHRLTPFLPAFTYTGVDYFGPLTVTMGGRGRRHEKKDGSVSSRA
jgi:Integrase zinc binding domain